MSFRHTSVMPDETVAFLNCERGKVVADCTVGGAGHAVRIAKKILPEGLLIGIDRDSAALAHAKQALVSFGGRVLLAHGNFADFPDILSDLGVPAVDGVLLDLGLSYYQIDGSGRGFSFRKDEPLDMRMDTDQQRTADMVVNQESEKGLARIFKEFGEERYAAKIARRIVAARADDPIRTTGRLARIVTEAYPARERHATRIDPATRVFMALRIAVNTELENLERFLDSVTDCLKPGARVCILSFHSLEDRMVKQRMKLWAQSCVCPPDLPVCVCDKKPVCRTVTRKAVVATPEEVRANPMARSAKLRVAEKI
ncbi:MAG: 16S rRNA (cytosine(1402)-N(4))-methyltransferase RsmH [Thermodesulfobacteriota bacterium]